MKGAVKNFLTSEDMKINQKMFDLANEELIVERQEFDNKSVEIYKLNDYVQIFDEFTNKGKFAVWSSVDGQNYRLFIEEGYYERVKLLYSKKINAIWLAFWDSCEELSNRYKKVIMPILLIVVAIIFGASAFIDSDISLIITLIAASAFTIFMLVMRRKTTKNINDVNASSIEQIKKTMGLNNFEQLLKEQREYIDIFFGYDEENEEFPNEEENVDEDVEKQDESETTEV